MVNFVALGSGCSLLPGYSRGIRQSGVTFRPLTPPNVSLQLAMIKKKSRGGLIDEICSFTVDAIRQSEKSAVGPVPSSKRKLHQAVSKRNSHRR
jgi:hypothetical protein